MFVFGVYRCWFLDGLGVFCFGFCFWWVDLAALGFIRWVFMSWGFAVGLDVVGGLVFWGGCVVGF